MYRLVRETIDAEAKDPDWRNIERQKDADEFERQYPTIDEPLSGAPGNIFGGAIPSGPEELMDWIQQYSNRTGFTGRLYGYNVSPQTPDHRILYGVLLLMAACGLLAFLGYLAAH